MRPFNYLALAVLLLPCGCGVAEVAGGALLGGPVVAGATVAGAVTSAALHSQPSDSTATARHKAPAKSNRTHADSTKAAVNEPVHHALSTPSSGKRAF